MGQCLQHLWTTFVMPGGIEAIYIRTSLNDFVLLPLGRIATLLMRFLFQHNYT